MKPQATINRGLNFSSSQRIAGLAYAVASASAKALVPCFKTQNLKFFLVILMVSASSITCSDRQKPREDSKKQSFSEIIRGFSAADTTRAGRYFSQAERLAKAAKYDSAIAYFEKASVLYEAEKNWEKHIRCRNKIGEQYWRQGAFDEALSYLNEVLETGRQRLGEQHLESAASYHNLGKVYNLTGQYEQALEFYQRALNIRLAKLGEQHPEVGSSYNDIGSVYYFQSDYDEAIKFYEKALAIRRHTLGERHADVAASCSNLANVYAQKGDYDLAIAGFNQALSVWLAVGSRLAAGAYHNLGNVYRDKGDFDQAILFHEKALSIQLSALGEQNPELAIYYYSLGNDYHSKEDYDRAIACFEKALSLRQRAFGRDHPEVASTYTALGVNHEEKGDYAKALDFYNMALSIWQATLGTQHPDAADVYQNIGSIALKKRDYTKAFVCYEKALSIYRATFGEHHPSVAIGCNEIGSIYVEQEAYDRALELFQRGICANAPEFSNPDPYVNPPLHGILDETELQTSLFNKARALARRYKRQSHQQRDLETALSTYELLVQLIDQIRSGYKAEGSKFFLAGTTTDIYEQAIQCALQLSEATQNAAPKNAAFLFAEKSKAGIMLDALSEAEAKQFAGIPDSLLAKEHRLRIDLAFYDRNLTEAQMNPKSADSTKTAQWRDKEFQLRQDYEALLERFEREYPDYYNLKYRLNTVTVAQVRNEILSENTALVEYFTGKDSL